MSLDPAFSFPPPESWGCRSPWRSGSASGRAYGGIAPELARALPDWLELGRVPGAETLKAPGIFRAGSLVVKFFPAPTVFGWVRPARALRSAEHYFHCLPIPSPRPLVALARWCGGPSLLVREYVQGALLTEAWSGDELARRELVPFLVNMLQHGVLHGDLHPRNLLWTGNAWLVLDVDGVRHRLHDPARVVEGQWVRLLAHLGDEAGLALAYRSYRQLLGPGRAFRDGPEQSWERILAQVGPAARRPAPRSSRASDPTSGGSA